MPVALAQQTNVTRFDAYAGYAFLDSPAIGLFENGFQFQAGVRANTVISLGFDYSRSTGPLTLTPNLLTTALQAKLGGQLAGLVQAGVIPANYTLVVPADSVTQESAAGPQFHYRHFKHVTIFLRPSIGAIHERATPKPGDPIAAAIAQQLAPSGHKTDWAPFYGFGYGFDVLLTNHIAIRRRATWFTTTSSATCCRTAAGRPAFRSGRRSISGPTSCVEGKGAARLHSRLRRAGMAA